MRLSEDVTRSLKQVFNQCWSPRSLLERERRSVPLETQPDSESSTMTHVGVGLIQQPR